MSESTALQKVDSVRELAQSLDYSVDYVQTVKDTIAKGATDLELKLFLQTAKRTGLDPFARQLFAIKRWDSSLKKETLTTQVSIDGFRLIADRTNAYVPGKETVLTFKDDGSLESATVFIKKLVGGEWHEISATAYYDEYVQKTREGKPNSMWQKMPRLMLSKCAESLALRKGFPAELSGLYTPEEMGSAEAVETKNERPVAQPVQSAAPVNPRNDSIAEICKQLNEEGDSIKWSYAQVNEYIKEFFSHDDWDLHALTDKDFGLLMKDLTERLEEMRAMKSESSDEPIDGEIADQEMSPEQFEDEVF